MEDHPTILLIEDELQLRANLQLLLQSAGYEVTTAANGAEGLQQLREHAFDLVITDQTMPHMTGEELALELRRLRSDIPIILCTGFSHIMQAERAQELGIDAFLMKPFTMQDLARVIQQVLASRRQPPP